MTELLLDHASRLIDAALARARELKTRPVAVAVLDGGGNLMALKREDDPRLMLPSLAIAKANAVIGMHVGGRTLSVRALKSALITALADASGGNFAPIPGGVLIRDASGKVIGAMGISGATADEDESCAVHAITALGFKADAGTA